jgi:hypothetical protein
MTGLLLALTISTAHAGQLSDWWRGFCERHLIANDPWPYADETNDWLIERYNLTGDEQIALELRARGLMKEQQ